KGKAITVVNGASTSGIDFTLVRGLTLGGTIREGSAFAKPIGGATVTVFDSARYTKVAEATSNNAGVYVTLAGLPSGSYDLVASDPDQRYAQASYGAASCDTSCTDVVGGTPVAVSTSRGDLDFQLTSGGSITGTVS